MKMIRYIPFIALAFLFLSCSSNRAVFYGKGDGPHMKKQNAFSNPLLASGADPWIVKRGRWYYFMCTNGGNITIRKTRAVTAVAQAAAVKVWSPPASGPHARNIWAPELHYLKGKWYLYYAAGASGDLSTQRCFVLENSSKDPTRGHWIDKGKIGDPEADFFSIDGSVFQYKGKHYFIWSGTASDHDNIQRIYIAVMKNPWTLGSHRVQISMPEYDWEKIGGQVNEGPEALQSPAGTLFVTFSVSQCATDDYGLGLLRLKEEGDPLRSSDWIKRSRPVFSKNVEENVFGPGHNGFFKSKNGKEYWLVYHANSHSGEGCGGGRSPRIQKITWKKNGDPDFGKPVGLSKEIPKPGGE
jgi:GH43 family beta-xylosidase